MSKSIIFPKPRILFLRWLEELNGQVKRLKIIQEGDLRVLYRMKKSLKEMYGEDIYSLSEDVLFDSFSAGETKQSEKIRLAAEAQ